uniref:Toxin candidate TRINITY_DN22084_c3_g36_i1 n=1 Tax=Isarachnanthus nocturnus TaxID=1240238 RepID=A0A7G7WZ58_9CNID|nr:toxin candidate TRINITY_DN22084_c3_g36_i1 [Isarachnanthus nocturnus]
MKPSHSGGIILVGAIHLFCVAQLAAGKDIEKCFTCYSGSSWEECKDSEISCSTAKSGKIQHCYKYQYTVQENNKTVSKHFKGCAVEGFCDTICSKKEKEGATDCQTYCCDEEVCNNVSALLSSKIFVASTGLIIGLVYLF